MTNKNIKGKYGIDQSLTKGDLNMLIVNAQAALEMAEEFVRDPDEGKGVNSMTLEFRAPKPEAQRHREIADTLDRQVAAAKAVREVRQQLRRYLGMRGIN